MSEAYCRLKPAHADIQSSSVVTCTVTAAASLFTFRRETPHSFRNVSVEPSGVYTVLLLDGQSDRSVPEGPTIVVVDIVRDDDCVVGVVGVADCVEGSGCDDIDVAEIVGAVEASLVLEPVTNMLLLSLLLIRLAPTPPPTAAATTITIATAMNIQKILLDNPHILLVRFIFGCVSSASAYIDFEMSFVVASAAILSEQKRSGVFQAFCGGPTEYFGVSSAITT